MSGLYNPRFYEIIRHGVRSSAEFVVPIMADWYRSGCIHHHVHPSVVDVGCGEGWWAREWVESGNASSADGIDGPWEGAGAAISAADLDALDYVPLEIDKINPLEWPSENAYSVALCLEVAEHLDNPEDLLVWLRRLAPVVFFSAAVPDQPGAGHVSCRWQADWADSFKDAGWHTADLRPRIWNHREVEFWYRQNLFVTWDPAGPIRGVPDEPILSVVHPELWKVRRDCR